jgi:hypothetical protein
MSIGAIDMAGLRMGEGDRNCVVLIPASSSSGNSAGVPPIFGFIADFFEVDLTIQYWIFLSLKGQFHEKVDEISPWGISLD